jgi:hypothetical protein
MPRKYWVFTIGQRDHAPPEAWLAEWEHHTHQMWFPDHKKPASVQAGARAMIYGSQAHGFIAAVEVLTGVREPNTSDNPDVARHPWVLEYRLLVTKAADANVASPEEAGIPTSRIQRGPHTRIEPDEYERAVEALAAAAARTAR